jgi:hypothetical protein
VKVGITMAAATRWVRTSPSLLSAPVPSATEGTQESAVNTTAARTNAAVDSRRAMTMPMTVESNTIWTNPSTGIGSPSTSSGTPAARRATTAAVVAVAATTPVARP